MSSDRRAWSIQRRPCRSSRDPRSAVPRRRPSARQPGHRPAGGTTLAAFQQADLANASDESDFSVRRAGHAAFPSVDGASGRRSPLAAPAALARSVALWRSLARADETEWELSRDAYYSEGTAFSEWKPARRSNNRARATFVNCFTQLSFTPWAPTRRPEFATCCRWHTFRKTTFLQWRGLLGLYSTRLIQRHSSGRVWPRIGNIRVRDYGHELVGALDIGFYISGMRFESVTPSRRLTLV